MGQLFRPVLQLEKIDIATEEKEGLYFIINNLVEEILTHEIAKAAGFLALNGIGCEISILDAGKNAYLVESVVSIMGVLPIQFSFTLDQATEDIPEAYIIGETKYYLYKSAVVDDKFVPADKIFFDTAEKMTETVMRAAIHLRANDFEPKVASDEINKLYEMSQ